jgi:hypothetical protein
MEMKKLVSVARAGISRARFMAVAAIGALIAAPRDAFAQNNLQTMGTTLHSGIAAWGPVLSAGTAVCGLAVCGGGLLKLKEAAADGGRQVKYSEGLWRIGAGAGLAGVPTVITSFLSSTVGTGGTVTNTGVTIQ